MAMDHRGPKDGPVRERDSTLAFKVRDPGAEGLVFPKTGRVDSLKERLSSFAHVGSTDTGLLNFKVFIDHIDGVKTLSFGGVAFDFVRTEGRTIFLISALPPGEMRKALSEVPEDVFDRCSIITSLASAPLHLYRISSRQLTLLESVSDNSEGEIAEDSVDILINIPDLQGKLKGSHVLQSEPGFDLAAFADSITDASGFIDNTGNTFIVISGSPDFTYSIYVDADLSAISSNSQQLCRFLNSGKVCVLCKEEIIY